MKFSIGVGPPPICRQHAPMLFGRFDNFAAGLNGDAQRLLQQDMQSAPQQGDGRRMMETVRRADVGGVGHAGLDQRLDAIEHAGLAALERGDLARALLGGLR
jgi:hypothetical protein